MELSWGRLKFITGARATIANTTIIVVTPISSNIIRIFSHEYPLRDIINFLEYSNIALPQNLYRIYISAILLLFVQITAQIRDSVSHVVPESPDDWRQSARGARAFEKCEKRSRSGANEAKERFLSAHRKALKGYQKGNLFVLTLAYCAVALSIYLTLLVVVGNVASSLRNVDIVDVFIPWSSEDEQK